MLVILLMGARTCVAQLTSQLEEFRQDKGTLVHVNVKNIDSTRTTRTMNFALIGSKGDTVRGSIRMPVTHRRTFPAAFLIVGIETGKSVVRMIEGHDSVIVVGIDYQFAGSYNFSGWDAVNAVFELRDACYRTVPQILLCLDWLFTNPLVDTSDVTLIAVSFGVFTAVPAAVIDQRVKRLAIVQAGGDLPGIIAANAERLGVPVPSWLAGWLGSWILAPFEPNRYIGSFSPRPVLLVSGDSDLLFPHDSVRSLYEHAGEPKEWMRHKSKHVMPGERELILELANIVAARLYGSP